MPNCICRPVQLLWRPQSVQEKADASSAAQSASCSFCSLRSPPAELLVTGTERGADGLLVPPRHNTTVPLGWRQGKPCRLTPSGSRWRSIWRVCAEIQHSRRTNSKLYWAFNVDHGWAFWTTTWKTSTQPCFLCLLTQSGLTVEYQSKF